MAIQAFADASPAGMGAASRWRVFLVSCSPQAGVPDHAWAHRTLARRWPNVPAMVFVTRCQCGAACSCGDEQR